jgi:predicted RNA binding protein YcfA (HicA-like mRNA interferase family)
MAKLPVVTARQVMKVLEGLGSHATYRHPDGRWTIVSVHGGKTIPGGTLRKIIRDTGLTVEEFSELL